MTRNDAVTFGYGAVAHSDTDFHRADLAPSRAHGSRLRGNDDIWFAFFVFLLIIGSKPDVFYK